MNKYILLLIIFSYSFFKTSNAQLTVDFTLGSGVIQGEYTATPYYTGEAITYYITLDFNETPVNEVYFQLTQSGSSSPSATFWHGPSKGYPTKWDFAVGEQYVLDVSSGLSYLQIDIEPSTKATISWSAAKNIVPSNGGPVSFINSNTGNDLNIQDYSNKSMGSVSSQTSDYTKAMMLLEQKNGHKLGLAPDKLSSNTSFGISSTDNIYQTANRHYFKTGTVDALTLYDEGKVGIGITEPDSELHVNGNTHITENLSVDNLIYANEIEVKDMSANNLNLNGNLAANNITVKANGQTADFVFSDTYNLKDLSEVEDYIKTHKHLPDIPSATQMEEQGVNLAEMNKLLLQKVEEMMLYLIKKEKEINKLKMQIDDLARSRK
ncbi:hypothetical protein [Plebeiibacterium marinum]|uniref:Peptidase S74 domain-containing protein n=1 Tax=Plebeiibacterium marinum TaxID=2992111 RepID=A0AAE3SLT2_9BACT|nr:hypothetical protein [Plebeiobacterium marinum]MCW3807938.1 hypothetical protein [Plebeiobacterium marinum]